MSTPSTHPVPPQGTPAPPPTGFLARLSPKHMVSFLITLILVVGEVQFHVLGGFDRLVIALGGCMLTELLLSRSILGRSVPVLSAYVSGNSLALLMKPKSELLWPFAAGAFLAIASKYALRFRGRHLWNPTNFSICVLLLVASPVIAILSHEWGNHVSTNVVIWAIGLVVVGRAKLLHVTLSYVVAFLGLALLRAASHAGEQQAFWNAYKAEIGPLTGPMYQLFVFFMITDPPTTVASFRGRIGVAVLIALCEHAMRVGLDNGLTWLAPFSPAPALFALFFVGPIAKAVSLELAARKAPAA